MLLFTSWKVDITKVEFFEILFIFLDDSKLLVWPSNMFFCCYFCYLVLLLWNNFLSFQYLISSTSLTTQKTVWKWMFFQNTLSYQSQLHRNTRKRSKISSKLTIKTPERLYWRRSGVLIVNFKDISHRFLVVLLLLWTGKC